MAGQKISQLTDIGAAVEPTDQLPVFDSNAATPATQNKRVRFHDFLSKITDRIIDKCVRLTKPSSAPTVSGAMEAAFYTDGVDFLVSINGGPFVPVPFTTAQTFGNNGEVGVIDAAGDIAGYPEFFFDETNNRFILGRSGVAGKFRIFSGIAPSKWIDLDAGDIATGHRIILPPSPAVSVNQILRVASISGTDIQLSYGPPYNQENTRLATANTSWSPNSDEVLLVDTTLGNVTITLTTPGATENNSGRIAKVSTDENEVILTPQAGLIAGAATYSFAGPLEGHGFVRHAGNWYLTN